jgi:hypothetical protein
MQKAKLSVKKANSVATVCGYQNITIRNASPKYTGKEQAAGSRSKWVQLRGTLRAQGSIGRI